MTFWEACKALWAVGVPFCIIVYFVHIVRWMRRRRRPLGRLIALTLLVVVVSVGWPVALALSFRGSDERGAGLERVWLHLVGRIGEGQGEVARDRNGRPLSDQPPPGPRELNPDPLINPRRR